MRPALALALGALALPAALAAQTIDVGEEEVLLEAETVRYDAEADRAVASGAVFLARGGYTLMADEVVYDRAAGRVEAVGDVVLVEPGGTTSFADRMALAADLEEGFVEGIAVRLADDSLAVARRGDRSTGRRTTFREVTYTPCPVCAGARPTWQINAAAVTHDQAEKVLRYEDATFEIAGVPVLFTPYFQHADPSVDRQSGFLAPTFTSDTELGFTAEIPYYWAIAPNRDLTVRPTFTTQENVVLALDFRDLQRFGRTDATVSGTYGSFGDTGEDRGRGHIDSRGRYDLGGGWLGGFDLYLATDDTYLRRYDIDDANVLDNRAFAQRVTNDRSIEVAALGFQGLRPDDDQGQIPFALPTARATYTGELGRWGGEWLLKPDLLALYRTEGIDSRRGSVLGEVAFPRVSPHGDVVTASASLRGDVYAVRGDAAAGVDDGDVRYRARLLPRATLDWRRPYARAGAADVSYAVEPVATFTAAPTGVNDEAIPNEDSLDLEFDETNLLRANRFTGLDLWDEGTKLSWGVRTAAVAPDRELWSVFAGQSYRLSETDVFDGVSGLEDELSDVVGRVGLSPHPWVDLDYRFRVDAAFDRLSKSDLEVVGGPPWLRVAIGHLLLDESTASGFARREEGRAALSVRFADNWSFIAATRRDLDAGEQLRNSAGILYEDACLTVALGVERDFTTDRDALASTTVALRVGFRNLGEFGGTSALVADDND